MADKSNAMTDGHALWQRVFREVAPRVSRRSRPRHLYIDALALLLVQDPSQFEVIVTNNLFGDIVTDLGAALQGGLGLAASGNLHPGRTSMFEPVHGSAPPLAGKNVANPVGAILSAALMLDYLGARDEAAAIEAAVRRRCVTGRARRTSAGRSGRARPATTSPDSFGKRSVRRSRRTTLDSGFASVRLRVGRISHVEGPVQT